MRQTNYGKKFDMEIIEIFVKALIAMNTW